MLKFSFVRAKVLPFHPKRSELLKWTKRSIQQKYNNVILSVSIVDEELSQQLNNTYRNIDKSTNVISLEYKESREQFSLLTGEIILCDQVIVREAKEQNKLVTAHYAHMVIHGMLHLQGYDHENDLDARAMEKLESEIMLTLGFADPYPL